MLVRKQWWWRAYGRPYLCGLALALDYDAPLAQDGSFTVNTPALLRLVGGSGAQVPRLTREFLCRAALVAVFAAFAHLFQWTWLRFVTSEAILRISLFLGMTAERVSSDTINFHGQLVEFVTACTFVDVYYGSIPLLWNLKKTFLRNVSWLVVVAAIFFALNVVRLEIGQILFAHGLSWMLADNLPGGVAYFAAWLLIWRQRTWELTTLSPAPVLRGNYITAPKC